MHETQGRGSGAHPSRQCTTSPRHRGAHRHHFADGRRRPRHRDVGQELRLRVSVRGCHNARCGSALNSTPDSASPPLRRQKPHSRARQGAAADADGRMGIQACPAQRRCCWRCAGSRFRFSSSWWPSRTSRSPRRQRRVRRHAPIIPTRWPRSASRIPATPTTTASTALSPVPEYEARRQRGMTAPTHQGSASAARSRSARSASAAAATSAVRCRTPAAPPARAIRGRARRRSAGPAT